jgi:hypothetical protein
MATDFFVGGGGLEPVQALVPIAANGGKDPKVIDAAACKFLQEGRKPDFRRVCNPDWTT